MTFFKKKRTIHKYGQAVASTIEISEDDAYEPLKYYSGIYTIRNITPETSDDLFYFFPENMIPGYVYAESQRTIDLIDNRDKLVISMVNSFYHSILDNMSELIYALKMYPKHKVIFDVSEMRASLESGEQYHNAFLYFLDILKKRKIDYEIVPLKKYDVIYINNFHVVHFHKETHQKANVVYDFFKPEFTNQDAKPTKNVFISRKYTTGRDYSGVAHGLSYTNDDRMDDHEAIDKYFESLGYEIVYSEFFNSFQEQIDYFYEAKTVASITGSGLSNAVFMQPGQIMIELVTPLVVPTGRPGKQKDLTDPYYVQELHNFYKNLAFFKDHLYLGIQSEGRSNEKIIEQIESDQRLFNFLDRSNE